MKYITFKDQGYTGGAITRPNERTLHCCITVDLHKEHTLHTSAIEHLYTDALLSGAGKYTREEFIDAVNMLGASLSVDIQNSRLTITLRSLTENAPKLLKLLETMMTSPTFTSTELKRIKIQTKNELLEHKENAKAIAQENFENNLYGAKDRRYSNTPDQLIQEIEHITPSDLKKLHAETQNNPWTTTIGSDQKTVDQVRKTIVQCKKNTIAKTTIRAHTQKPQAKKQSYKISQASKISSSQ